MTAPTYAELRRLHEAATPGPWKHWDADGVKWDDPNACGYDSREHHRGPPYYATGPRAGSSEQADADAALIAAMRNAIPGLLREAEAGRKLRERVKCYRCQEDGDEVVCHTCAALADYDREVETLSAQRDERDAVFALLERIVRYAREDRMRTPGYTRLARALVEADRLLAKARTGTGVL